MSRDFNLYDAERRAAVKVERVLNVAVVLAFILRGFVGRRAR